MELAPHESRQPRPSSLVRAREEGLEVSLEHLVTGSALRLAAVSPVSRLVSLERPSLEPSAETLPLDFRTGSLVASVH